MSSPPPSTPRGDRSRHALVNNPDTPHGLAIVQALTAAGWQVDPFDPAGAPGTVDALILTGDEPAPTPFADISLAQWQAAIDQHLRGAYDACRAVLPGMIERGGGSIIAVTPSSALNGTGAAHHAAAASAVIGMVKGLAREVGPHGVIVNAVAPGPLDGRPTQAAPTPPGGLTTAEDLGATVRYLAEERHYFAGSVLAPNGGSHL